MVTQFINVDITAEEGSIDLVQAAGYIAGHIRALEGGITTVVGNSHIGPLHGTSLPVDIKAKDGIDSVWTNNSSGTTTAAIAANAYGGAGDLTSLQVVSGGFSGSIATNDLEGTPPGIPGISIQSGSDAEITVDGSLNRGIQINTSSYDATLRIGGGIGSDAPITLPANGLVGQIVLNANNEGGAWLSDITIGGVALSPIPDYAQTSAQLGGGAVGYAPYNVHLTDCNPPHGLGVTYAQLPKPVRVRHYGPVTSGGGGTPLTVETRFYPGGGAWADITSDFKFTLHPANNLRDIGVEQKVGALIGFQAGREYRIRPVATGSQSDLRCLLVKDSPLVMPYQYIFAITGP